jgi:hypothetical protein
MKINENVKETGMERERERESGTRGYPINVRILIMII